MVILAGGLALTHLSLASPEPLLERSAGPPGGNAAVTAPLPSANQVIQRMMDRSAATAAATNAPAWAYDKRTLLETLDGDAKVEERTEKLYRVRIIQGVPFSRLVKVAGHDLSAAEIKKENEREAAFQKQLSGRDPKKVVKQREAFVTKDMVERFHYQVLRHIHPAPEHVFVWCRAEDLPELSVKILR